MRARKVLKLSDFLRASLSEPLNRGLVAMDVCREWSNMLGGHVAQYSSDAVFRNGELSVRILSSVLRNDLYMQKTLLVNKLNMRLGKDIVKSIRFR